MESTPSGWNQYFNLHGSWFVEIIISLLVLFALNVVVKQAVAYFRRKAISTSHEWKSKIDQIVYLPFYCALWVMGAVFVLDVLSRRFGFSFFSEYLRPFRNAVVLGCAAWMVLRWIKEVQHSAIVKAHLGKRPIDPGMMSMVGKVSSFAVIIVTALIVLQMFGINILPLIAFGGIGAAAVGFAGKDVIANFFGGAMIHITRPFTIGDLILVPDRNLEGHVEEIGWYLTSVRDKDKRPVYLPNAIFSHTLVINSSRMSHRRIEENISISTDDYAKLKVIVEEIRKEIGAHPRIDTHLPVIVNFNRFSEYALEIYIDVYALATRMEEYLAVKEEILMAIQEILATHGAHMPLPTQAVVLKENRSLDVMKSLSRSVR